MNNYTKEQIYNYGMRDISGYEGLYAATSCGRIWSYKSKKFLKLNKTSKGYLRVKLYKNNKGKNYFVHRLVLETYRPIEGMDKLDCNHRDECKENNSLNNLEWLTHKDNNNYGTHNQRSAISRGKPVRCIETKEVFTSACEAARQTGFSQGNISNCCNGKRKTVNGYHFIFEKDFQDMLVAELLEKTFLDNNN